MKPAIPGLRSWNEGGNLTALLSEARLFHTGSIPMPASRFLCEHLRQNLVFWACSSRIHAQDPVITTGQQLVKTLQQQVACCIDIAVMADPASRALPLPLIQPQLIKGVPALRAGLARGIPAIHLDQDFTVPLAFISELPAHLAERDIVDRTGVSPARQRLDVQVFDTNHIELTHQTGRELMQGVLALLFHLGMDPRHPQPLLLAPSTTPLPTCQAALLLAQVSQVCVIAFGIRDLLPGRERGQVRESQVYAHRALYDRQPGRLDLHGETHVVAPDGIAREGYRVRPLHLGER